MARVLVTRAMPEAEETAESLMALGHMPVLAPLRIVEGIGTPFPAEKPDALIVTSRNALVQGAALPADWLAVPVFCVGRKTAGIAADAGFKDIRIAGGDAVSLASQIIENHPAGSRLLYLAGEPRGPELEANLQCAGVSVVVLLRYRMHRIAALPEAASHALAAQALDAVLHFSAESARAFFFLAQSAGFLGAASAIPQFCLSDAVARAATEQAGGRLTCIIAPKRTGEDLVEAFHREFR